MGGLVKINRPCWRYEGLGENVDRKDRRWEADSPSRLINIRKLRVVLVGRYPLRREFRHFGRSSVHMCGLPGMSQIPIGIVETGAETRKREFRGAKRIAAVRCDSRDWALHYVGRQKSWANVGTARRNFPGRLTVVLNRARQSNTGVYICPPWNLAHLRSLRQKIKRRQDGCVRRRRRILSCDNSGASPAHQERCDVLFNNALILLVPARIEFKGGRV